MPEVISEKDENAVTSLLNVLKEKWEHILPLPAAFESELVESLEEARSYAR